MLPEQKLLQLLIKHNLTLAIAESCTGGELSNRITNIPGSSKAFLLGVVTYSNSAKNKILKIPLGLIHSKGAVCAQVAEKMAQNIRKLASSDIAIGISGIAGPDGGTKEKPVGTVFIAVSSNKKTTAQKFHFTGNRMEVKRKAANKAIGIVISLT